MFDDDVREKIFAKSELQKIDLMTLSLVIKAKEEVLEENKDEHAVSATNDEKKDYQGRAYPNKKGFNPFNDPPGPASFEPGRGLS